MRKNLFAAFAGLALAAAFPVAAQQAPAPAAARMQAPDTSWVGRSAIYEIFVRDFSPTGNFRGVIAGLDRVQAVGADVIWLMPIHPVGVANRKGQLGSPYAVQDYRAINPAFGTAADFRALVQAVHARGMKIIIDWVPNHTAWDNVWTREHPDYYVRDSSGGLTVPRDDQGRLTDWTDVAQLNFRNPALRQAMIATMRWWLEEYGIDGFRVDAAGFVPDEFWREAVPAVRAAVPRRILMLAEWGDLKMHRFGFDLSYSWGAYSRFKSVWGGGSAAAFVRGELADLRDMPAGGSRLRFSTNHDETGWDDPPVTRFGNVAGARAAFVALALLPGRPLLYNGQEVESPQKLALFGQETVDWNRAGAAQARAFYQRIVHLARTDPAFLTGTLGAVTTTDTLNVIAYARGDVVVLVNTRGAGTTFTLSGADVNGARDLLSNRTQTGATVTLPAWGTVALRRTGVSRP